MMPAPVAFISGDHITIVHHELQVLTFCPFYRLPPAYNKH
jgi:hypothetical protein